MCLGAWGGGASRAILYMFSMLIVLMGIVAIVRTLL